ncbi:MAG: autotransporter, partial [Candidatus Marinimicrobia bacterium CG_4_9_14_3_um_filter_48_9]
MFRTRLVGDGKKALKALSLTLVIQLMLPASGMAQSPATVDLGTASSFVVLAAAGITNTGTTMLDGDIGSFPTTTITGFPPGEITGVNHGGDETTQAAMIALNAAYVDAAGRSSTTIASELGGTERTTGVYSAG